MCFQLELSKSMFTAESLRRPKEIQWDETRPWHGGGLNARLGKISQGCVLMSCMDDLSKGRVSDDEHKARKRLIADWLIGRGSRTRLGKTK